MSYGGRPKIGRGHEAFNVSMESDVLERLEKKVRNKSEFIEKAITPLLNQLDPGPSCAFLSTVDNIARQELVKATFQKDYAKISTIGSMMDSWRDYRQLCADNRADCENAGGIWKGNECVVRDN
jgi:hypothetical protein